MWCGMLSAGSERFLGKILRVSDRQWSLNRHIRSKDLVLHSLRDRAGGMAKDSAFPRPFAGCQGKYRRGRPTFDGGVEMLAAYSEYWRYPVPSRCAGDLDSMPAVLRGPRPCGSPHGPASPPHCRTASYATIAAQLERLRLRTCGREGIVRSLSGLAARRSLGRPRDSLPNTSTAPFL